jgi:uncharacterized protein YbaA (DUF1428 family)
MLKGKSKMSYIDMFVCAVPTQNREAYVEHVTTTTALLKSHGALQVMECWGDDVPDGKLTSLPMAVKCKSDETVACSFIVWASRNARDEGMKAFMADPRLAQISMPFDGQRLIFGGFKVVSEA